MMNISVLIPACLLFSLGTCAFLQGPVAPESASGGNLLQQLMQPPAQLAHHPTVGSRTSSQRAERRTLAAVEQDTNVRTGTAGWAQRTVTVTAPRRGCHLITADITQQVPELRSFKVGMANIFLKHTSASLTINENADPDVRTDMEAALNQIVPVKWHNTMFRHTLEGPDDMTGHVKSTIVGASLNIPVTNGGLALGTWQGIYLCEHRDTGGWGDGFARDIVVTIQGMTTD